MPPDDDFTLGEIGRWLKRLSEDIGNLTNKFEGLAATFVLQAVYTADKRAQDEKEAEQDRRVTELEESNRWLTRAVLGTVIMMVLTGALAAYFTFAAGA